MLKGRVVSIQVLLALVLFATAAGAQPLSGITAISSGRNFSLALAKDGTVWAWGENGAGELGDGTTKSRVDTPIQIPNLTNITAIAAGYYHSLALAKDGTVWAWGDNSEGGLGDGTQQDRRTPIHIPNLSGIMAIAAGYDFSLALAGDGTVWSWGRNDYGQLGVGTGLQRQTPTHIPNLSGIMAIAAGEGHTLALAKDGTVWAWGGNIYGELGSLLGGHISALTGITAIAAGEFYSLALAKDGTVWAWGDDSFGQLGFGEPDMGGILPTRIPNLTSIKDIAAKVYHTLALDKDGTVWEWGRDDTTIPTKLPSLTGITAITAGEDHALALAGDGTVWAWGGNFFGQLGAGPMQNQISPVQVRVGP